MFFQSDFKQAHAVSFRPFASFVESEVDGTMSLESHRSAIEAAIDSERYAEAQEMSMNLVKLGLEGLRYFQT